MVGVRKESFDSKAELPKPQLPSFAVKIKLSNASLASNNPWQKDGNVIHGVKLPSKWTQPSRVQAGRTRRMRPCGFTARHGITGVNNKFRLRTCTERDTWYSSHQSHGSGNSILYYTPVKNDQSYRFNKLLSKSKTKLITYACHRRNAILNAMVGTIKNQQCSLNRSSGDAAERKSAPLSSAVQQNMLSTIKINSTRRAKQVKKFPTWLEKNDKKMANEEINLKLQPSCFKSKITELSTAQELF